MVMVKEQAAPVYGAAEVFEGDSGAKEMARQRSLRLLIGDSGEGD